MWRSRSDGDVTCIACGDEVPRSKAREYDRYGDRWGSRDREFEYLCKPCHRECCHQPRKGLEETLIKADAGHVSRDTFVAQFHDIVSDGAADSDSQQERETERE
ncbi:DUF7562 family protein [Salinibaculum salinum]|uniref:DUF7562 family protein n=1 Tax=Salinibaculum salinum TaxID=3131996 RepID=UPI0030EC8FEA